MRNHAAAHQPYLYFSGVTLLSGSGWVVLLRLVRPPGIAAGAPRDAASLVAMTMDQ